MDAYKILGLSSRENVTDEVVKNAYRAKAKILHPDLNKGKDTSKAMAELNQAYAMLRTAEDRAKLNQEKKVQPDWNKVNDRMNKIFGSF